MGIGIPAPGLWVKSRTVRRSRRAAGRDGYVMRSPSTWWDPFYTRALARLDEIEARLDVLNAEQECWLEEPVFEEYDRVERIGDEMTALVFERRNIIQSLKDHDEIVRKAFAELPDYEAYYVDDD